jgi:hypothetical protein
MELKPILTPLPYCPEREARRVANDTVAQTAEVLIAAAVDEYRAGRPHQYLIDEAVAVCDAHAGNRASHRTVTERLFILTLTGKRRT